MAGTDGGWVHVKRMKARHVTPTKIVSSDFESSWVMLDKQILNPKEWCVLASRYRWGRVLCI
jgi:hypothetical protein